MESKKKLKQRIAKLEAEIAEYERCDDVKWCSYCEGYKRGRQAQMKLQANANQPPPMCKSAFEYEPYHRD